MNLSQRFFLEKHSYFASRNKIEQNLKQVFASHDHVNLYYPCGGEAVKTIQVNTLDRTEKTPSWLSGFKRLASELGEHAMASYTPGFLFGMAQRDAESDLLLRMLNRSEPTVLPSPAGFTRQLYYLHDEVEYAFPLRNAREVIAATVELLRIEELHSIVEVRYTPDSAVSMIGPGRVGCGEGGAIWLGIAAPIGEHTDLRIRAVFEEFDRIARPFGGRPHMGKQTAKNESDMAALFGDDWTTFQKLRRTWDCDGKFLPTSNAYLQRVFG